MVNSQFGAILKIFEDFFHCPLEPDSNHSCLINVGIGISIQLELDRYGLLLIGCRLGALPASRYRDNLIQAALKSNEASHPSTGVLGFSHKSNQLILFIKLNPNTLTTQTVNTSLPSFMTKAKQWADAISKGEIPLVTQSGSSHTPSGLFGLISN
jgi:hypothetical protein